MDYILLHYIFFNKKKYLNLIEHCYDVNLFPLNRGSIWFYRSYQIYKKFYVRINFIKLILQKIRSSTCKGDSNSRMGKEAKVKINPPPLGATVL
jgi:hypothetical protein